MADGAHAGPDALSLLAREMRRELLLWEKRNDLPAARAAGISAMQSRESTRAHFAVELPYRYVWKYIDEVYPNNHAAKRWRDRCRASDG